MLKYRLILKKIKYVEIDLDLFNETEIINYIENKLNE